MNRPFPSDLKTQAGITYIIDREITLTEDLNIAPGVCLIFQGGKFTNGNPLTDNGFTKDVKITALSHSINDRMHPNGGVSLIAPMSVIFGLGITVTGNWKIEFATPLWFETTQKPLLKNGTELQPDFADAINKAIIMKGHGDVFLPHGSYYISVPIMISNGVSLKGEPGQLYDVNATLIRPMGIIADTTNEYLKFPHPRMVYVNSSVSGDPITKYTYLWTALSNIQFLNDVNIFPAARCVLASYTSGYENVVLMDFVQAIGFVETGTYSDCKSIVSCVAFNDHITIPESNAEIAQTVDDMKVVDPKTLNDIRDVYANATAENPPRDLSECELQVIDLLIRNYYCMMNLHGLGDALVFRGNHLSSAAKSLLYLNECGGGVIDANIINGDIKIYNCKGIQYTSNHMEGGAQIHIIDSEVELNSNYIEKGNRPSVILEGLEKSRCVVTSSQNMFIFYSVNQANDMDKISEDEFELNLDKKEQRFITTSDVEFVVDTNTCLTIRDTFRYDLVVGFGAMVPFGVRVNKPDGEFSEFNEISHFASQSSTILPGYKIRSSRSFSEINAPWFYHIQTVGHTNWFKPTGDYAYKYEIIWNEKRKIDSKRNGQIISPVNGGDGRINLTYQGEGVLLIFNAYAVGNQMHVRLHRYRMHPNRPISHEVVDLPISGCNTIYDNGISIAGFKWREVSLNDWPSASAYQEYSQFEFNDGCISAYTEKLPSLTSDWNKGDKIYNVGPDSDWVLKIIK